MSGLFFPSLLNQFSQVLSVTYFGMNIVDLVILAVICFYCYGGYVVGVWLAGLDFINFIASFILGLVLYKQISTIVISVFSLPQGLTNAAAFFLVALMSEVVLGILLRKAVNHLPPISSKRIVWKIIDSFNHYLGIIPGFASAYIVISFVLTIAIALPSSAALKQAVANSRFGGVITGHTEALQQQLGSVFGGAIQETLNVITIKPESSESIPLRFTVTEPTPDPQSETQMYSLINEERVKVGLPVVMSDPRLTALAREYAVTMFKLGYFSHYTPDNKSPFDRMDEAGISYFKAGENLALAPSTKLAHQGLMNSPGHKANILSPDFGKVGVGVMDGGAFGKMYVQEFTD